MNRSLLKIINVTLILFVFGVNFENWDPFGLQGVFSIAKITAIFYILSWLPQLKYLRLKPLKYFLIPLLLYLFVEFLSSSFNSIYASGIYSLFNFKLIQLLILLVLIVSHIYRNPKIHEWVLYTYVSNVLFLSVLSANGIGHDVAELEDGGRLSIFGENPNIIGMKASFAVIILFYLIFNVQKAWVRTISVAALIPIISMLVSTASRGALLSIFVGLAVLMMIQPTSAWRKVSLFSIGSAFSWWLFNFIMSTNEKFATRMNIFLEEGKTGRNDLWEGAYSVILDNLLIGVGRPGALPVMQQYIGRAMDPHNVFLYVFMTTGIFGFIFFMNFIFRVAIRLFKNFKATNNALYIVLYAILLFNMSKAGGFINSTFLWFFFSLFIGSTIISSRKHSITRKNIFN